MYFQIEIFHASYFWHSTVHLRLWAIDRRLKIQRWKGKQNLLTLFLESAVPTPEILRRSCRAGLKQMPDLQAL